MRGLIKLLEVQVPDDTARLRGLTSAERIELTTPIHTVVHGARLVRNFGRKVELKAL